MVFIIMFRDIFKATANIFIGQVKIKIMFKKICLLFIFKFKKTEAPLLIKPFLINMTRVSLIKRRLKRVVNIDAVGGLQAGL